MFWIAFLGVTFALMFAKLGFLSATVSLLFVVVKLLFAVILVGLMGSAWFWLRRKSHGSSNQN